MLDYTREYTCNIHVYAIFDVLYIYYYVILYTSLHQEFNAHRDLLISVGNIKIPE